MAKAKFIDSAKELEQQAKQLFERIKKTHTDMGTTLQEVRRAEGKLIEKEKAAEKERIETERAERLRELLASEGDLAFHVGEPDEVQSAVQQEEKTAAAEPPAKPREELSAAQDEPAPEKETMPMHKEEMQKEEPPKEAPQKEEPQKTAEKPAKPEPEKVHAQQQKPAGPVKSVEQKPVAEPRRQEPRQRTQSGYQAQPQAQTAYQQRSNQQRPAGQGGYQQRPAGQGGYQQRPAGQGGYQQRPAGQGGYQQRPAGQGGYQQRPAVAPIPAAGKEQRSFDANKSAHTRTRDDERNKAKNKKTLMKESAPMARGWDEDGAYGSKKKKKQQAPIHKPEPVKIEKAVITSETITVKELSEKIGKPAAEIIKKLFMLGIMATINQTLDIDTATLVAAEFGYEVEKVGFSEDDYLVPKEVDAPETLKPRPPVVTIMGHVDHGKTSLLDAIRKSNVTSGEAGGITQHIGAYHVKTKRGEIVFLDTPGHEAFTAMRARGAQVTDLVILVVAADDGVMEQTREAINHSRAANVPIMVAVNKMDKPGAEPDRVLRELAELGLQAEEWGGDTIVAKVSAKSRMGLDELLEMVALQSEIMELKANPDKPARGHIVEAKLDKGRGPIATVLIQEGTLRQGDSFVCGTFSGRVRALMSDQGKKVKDAGPSLPVEVQGFEGVPEAGEEFFVVSDEKVARRIADSRAVKQRERDLASESRVTLETFLSQRKSDQETLTLNLVVKADVQGSLEAITEALNKQSTEKVRINVVHGGTGAITESDILLASASQAIIIGFNVRPTSKIKDVADHENVDIRFYEIIYKLVDDIKSAMAGMLAPVQREVYLGQAEVRDTFSVPKVGVIAGSYVADGKIARNAGVRLLRDGVVVYTGKISSLKRFKDDSKEVVKGNECGVGLENFNDVKIGDIIEAFETVEEAATL